jgi:SAM-dependent methyltransferase
MVDPSLIGYETLRTFALTHNYNQWILGLLKPFMGNRILEIGCGIGNLSCYLRSLGSLICLDNSKQFVDHMKIDYPDIPFYHYDVSDDRVRTLSKENLDTIICVNVLEHVEDDIKALTNMWSILRPNGTLLLFVPALNVLYSEIDRKLGHFRRYDRKSLTEKLRCAGFQIKELQYKSLLAMAGWFLRGRIWKKERVPVLQTILFDRFLPLIARIEGLMTLPFGMSLFAVAQKPATAENPCRTVRHGTPE